MIKRIVRMDLLPQSESIFLEIFESVKNQIRMQQGCMGLELLRSNHQENLNLWTISFWQTADDLETYRTSPLFRKTWTDIKPLFASKAEAWTLTSIDLLK